MSQPVNLNKARKARAKTRKRAQAEENVVVHGLSKSQRALGKARSDKDKRQLDGHKRDPEHGQT